MKGSYSSLVELKGSGVSDSSLGHSRALGTGQAWALLDEASDLLVVHRNFAAVLEVCERGCQAIGTDPESQGDDGSTDVKTSLCIVGIQALAEMNRWREVLSWLLKYYEVPEKLPVKLLELCILLHSTVQEPSAMLDVAGDWLRSKTNQSRPEYSAVVKLYLMQVLMPLGRFDEAEDLVLEGTTLSEKQRQDLLETIEERKQALCAPNPNEKTEQANQNESVPEEKQTLGGCPDHRTVLRESIQISFHSVTQILLCGLPFPWARAGPAIAKRILCAFMRSFSERTKIFEDWRETVPPYYSTGAVPRRLKTLLSFLYRVMASAGSHILSLPIKKMVLAALLLCLLMLRLDSASSTAQPFLSTLLQMLKQVWAAIGPVQSRPGIYH